MAKRFRGKTFEMHCGPPNAQYFDADGKQIAGPKERRPVPLPATMVGPVPIELAQSITGKTSPSYFEVIKATSNLTGASVDYLDGLPDADFVEFVRGALVIRSREPGWDELSDPEKAERLKAAGMTWKEVAEELTGSDADAESVRKMVERHRKKREK